MASTSLDGTDLALGPNLYPIYPSPANVVPLLATDSGLSASQKSALVAHCIVRSCVLGDLSALTFLLSDPHARPYIDLGIQDEDATGLVSLTIHGFGADSERDVEREECIRLLIAHGADPNVADNAGWTALHHAALLAPPTLVSHLMTHGCSLFSVTRRNLTALDIVTAHSTIPGREDVALLLEEAMRGEGWTGGKKEERRKSAAERDKRVGNQKIMREDLGKALGVDPNWWGDEESDDSASDSSSQGEGEADTLFTPCADYTTMLAYSPPSLPEIFDTLIADFPPTLQNTEPANALYMLARFACLTCDYTWLEDLIIGATDAIEETFFSQAEDITCLIFWLYNTTAWLHLMQCDNLINEACEMIGSFEMIEEVINSAFVFIIRFAERKIDQFLDAALLDHSPMGSEFDSIKFESEWAFLRPFSSKKKAPPNVASGAPSSPLRTPTAASPGFNTRPPSPSLVPSSSRGFSSSLRHTFNRTRTSSSISTLNSLFADAAPPPMSPADLTSILTDLHTLLTISEINPILTTQLWSQVMYWTSCEMFNRILTRKKYLCRSKAVQISMNLGAIEEWIGEMGLPRGVASHFAPVRALLVWLQCSSSIAEFPNLVATIQSMKCLNPLQMRRAVRDYKYEVNEGRMTDECVQYLTQLQKDWERQRVKLGVQALRKEIVERDLDRDPSASSAATDTVSTVPAASATSECSVDLSASQRGIDLLFDRSHDWTTWEPAQPPQALGELMDSRYMLPLLLPSDPRMLSARSGKLWNSRSEKRRSAQHTNGRSSSRNDRRRGLDWQPRHKKIREVGIDILQWVDGIKSASRWGRPVPPEESGDESSRSPFYASDDPQRADDIHSVDGLPRITPLTRKPSARSKGRQSTGGGETFDGL